MKEKCHMKFIIDFNPLLFILANVIKHCLPANNNPLAESNQPQTSHPTIQPTTYGFLSLEIAWKFFCCRCYISSTLAIKLSTKHERNFVALLFPCPLPPTPGNLWNRRLFSRPLLLLSLLNNNCCLYQMNEFSTA